MKRAGRTIRRFAQDESGSTAIEYALILIIVSVVIISSLISMRTTLSDTLTKAGQELKTHSAAN